VMSFREVCEADFENMMPCLVKENSDIKTQEDVNTFVSKLYEEEMTIDLPLWRAFVVNNLADGRSVLVLNINHAIGDGVSQIQGLMGKLMDKEAGGNQPIVPEKKASSQPVQSRYMLRGKGLLKALWGPFVGDNLPADPPNLLKAKDPLKPGKAKACAMTEAVTIERVKQVKGALPGATVNDVLMTLACMTLQDYFQKYEPKTLQQKFRANFPINMRTVTGSDILLEEHFGNRFSQGQLRFPLHLQDPKDIFRNLKNQLDVIKVSPEPYVREQLVNHVVLKSGTKYADVGKMILNSFGKVSAMLSNVPGPLGEVRVMNRPLDDLTFYALCPIGLYFGVVQYNGSFKAGICCDSACEPDPQRLAACWAPAFERLYTACV